jgi:hypothetical protein
MFLSSGLAFCWYSPQDKTNEAWRFLENTVEHLHRQNDTSPGPATSMLPVLESYGVPFRVAYMASLCCMDAIWIIFSDFFLPDCF